MADKLNVLADLHVSREFEEEKIDLVIRIGDAWAGIADLQSSKRTGSAVVKNPEALQSTIKECRTHARVLQEAIEELGDTRFDENSVTAISSAGYWINWYTGLANYKIARA